MENKGSFVQLVVSNCLFYFKIHYPVNSLVIYDVT